MTTATIIVLSIGVILILISFLLTGKDEAKEEEPAEEKTTPGLREDLTDADKKQLRKLTDNFIREYGKKQVKDLTKSAIDAEVKSATAAKQPVIEEKITEKLNVIDQKMAKVDQKLAEIDARSEAGVKAVSNQASAISAGWAEDRQQVQTVYEQIVEKEKEVKLQLGLIDEYKKGLEKLKEDADLSVNRLQELQQVEAGRIVPVAVAEAAENAAEMTEEATSEAGAAAEAAEDVHEAAAEAMENTGEAAEAADEVVEAAEDEAEEATEAEDSFDDDEAEEDEAQEEADSDDDDEDDPEADSEDAYDAAEESEEGYDAAEDSEESYDGVEEEDEEYPEDDYDEENADGARASSNIVAFPQEVDQEAIEEATKETLGRVAQQVEEDASLGESDEYDDDAFDEDFDENDDLQTITNLDQILDREGIDLSAEDPTINILTMYGAGLSIIEISKVLKMGVGEVKYIIDSNTSNQ